MVYEESTEVVAEVENVAAMPPEVLNHEPLAAPENVMPPVESLTIEARPPMQVEPPIEQQALPPEQLYYQQPPRPITEMLGTGSFYFLQVKIILRAFKSMLLDYKIGLIFIDNVILYNCFQKPLENLMFCYVEAAFNQFHFFTVFVISPIYFLLEITYTRSSCLHLILLREEEKMLLL